jgi:hypothetical protein
MIVIKTPPEFARTVRRVTIDRRRLIEYVKEPQAQLQTEQAKLTEHV